MPSVECPYEAMTLKVKEPPQKSNYQVESQNKMNTKIKTVLFAALGALTLGAFTPSTAKADGCSTSRGRISIDFGQRSSSHYSNRDYRSSRSSGYSNSGYNRGYRSHQPSYRDVCSLVDTCYFVQGCNRYAKYTYRHQRIDCHGHVVQCWTTYKTVCVGRVH
jgi:hypothetical protein